MSFRKKAGENRLILQVDLKDTLFWLLLMVEGDVFESKDAACSMAICLTPQEIIVTISWCTVRLCKISTFSVAKVLTLFGHTEHHPPGKIMQAKLPRLALGPT